MRAQLIPLEGGPPLELVKDVTLVGRKEICDLRLDHRSVSKMHCVFVKTEGMLLLRDLGSTNGTRVNGQRVRRAALLPNDQVDIAQFKFKVFLGPDAMPPHNFEATQHLDPGEIASMEHAAGSPADAGNPPVLRPRPLPDVYPQDEPRT